MHIFMLHILGLDCYYDVVVTCGVQFGINSWQAHKFYYWFYTPERTLL